MVKCDSFKAHSEEVVNSETKSGRDRVSPVTAVDAISESHSNSLSYGEPEKIITERIRVYRSKEAGRKFKDSRHIPPPALVKSIASV